MLSMARALTTDPDILLLDELSMGLAPLIVEELYGVVGQLVASEQLTIVMVEQFVQTALSIADRAAIMVNGEVVKRASPTRSTTRSSAPTWAPTPPDLGSASALRLEEDQEGSPGWSWSGSRRSSCDRR